MMRLDELIGCPWMGTGSTFFFGGLILSYDPTALCCCSSSVCSALVPPLSRHRLGPCTLISPNLTCLCGLNIWCHNWQRSLCRAVLCFGMCCGCLLGIRRASNRALETPQAREHTRQLATEMYTKLGDDGNYTRAGVGSTSLNYTR
jgi:hypothetical protein